MAGLRDLISRTIGCLVVMSAASAALAASTAPHPTAPAAARLLQVDDFYGFATLADPDLSPDGAWVAYVVRTFDRQADEARSAVWMVSWDGAADIPITRSAKGIRSPHFSPDGRFLAFIASDSTSGRDELEVLDRRGGEPRAVSDAEDIGEYAWSPDGERIVAVMHGRTVQDPKKPPQPIVIDALYFKQDEEGYLGTDSRRSLYLIDIAAGTTVPLTGGSDNEASPAWSPDGHRIAFVRTRELGPDPDGREEIVSMDARAGAASTRLTRIFAPNRQRLAWTHEGSSLLYLTGQEPRLNQYIQDRLAIAALEGGAQHELLPTLDRDVTSFVLIPEAQALEATIADDGTAYAVRVSLAGGRITRIAQGAHVLTSIAHAGAHTAALVSDDHAPGEVYALEEGRLRKLTSHNDALLSKVRLGAVEDIRYQSKDGTAIHGFLVNPPDAVAGRSYPTMVWLHGGPNAQDAHELKVSSDPLIRQLRAARGYRVFGVNYRGSNGRGRAFQASIAADWGHRELDDILAGVDRLSALGLADPHRLAIGGWSYGAILTDFAIAADGRFKAAISGAGSGNPTAMYGHDEYIIQYNSELGVPWSNGARWLEISSPLLQANRIRTPTLFMGGDQDFDVPLVGGEQMYQALKTLGVPTTLVVYPGEFHSLRRPSFVVDRMTRIAAWLDRYL